MRAAFEIIFIFSAYVVFDTSLSFFGASATVCRLASLMLAAAISAIYLLFKSKKNIKDAAKSFLLTWEIKRFPASACVACALLGFGLNGMCSSIISLLPQSITASYVSASAPLGALTLVSVIDTVVLAPMLEELLFRKVILGRLRTFLPCAASLVISALLFGSFHGGIIWIIYSTACGLALGAVYLKYASLLAPLAMHAAFNGSNYLFSLLPFSISPYLLICVSAALSAIAAAYMLVKRKNTEA